MRAGLGVLIVIVITLPEQARSQGNPDMDTALTIAIHPGVSTILQLPDDIVDTWIEHTGEIKVARVGNEIAVRPRAGTPAGVEVLLEVETRTMHRTFRLRVVARARDAHRDVLVLPAEDEQDAGEPAPEALSGAPAEPPAPAEQEPPARTSTSPPSPAPPEPLAGPEPAAEPAPAEPAATASSTEPVPAEAEPVTPAATTAANGERTGAAGSSRVEFSLHGFASLAGTTEVRVAGYEAKDARRSHRVFGMRIAGRRPGALWGGEVNVSGEWLAGPTTHRDDRGELVVSGPWLRADGGLRVRFEGHLTPTAYAGIGLQAHHRDIVPDTDRRDEGTNVMPFGGVLALGLGLEYRAGDMLLGLELHVRQGLPAEYRSVGAFLSAGLFLDRGE
jgi:hypothetical protein